MGLMDILEQYASQGTASASSDAHQDFSNVASQAPPGALGDGIAQALRNGQDGFPAAVEKLFGNSNTEQRTGLLSQLIAAAGPAILGSFAGGALSHLGQSGTSVQPADANAVTPSQAGQLAEAARQNDPSIVDRVGSFYSQHPAVVKALGAAALAMVMSHMARKS